MIDSTVGFTYLKPGDTVTRLVGGRVPIDVKVSEVTLDKIVIEGGWEFDRTTGHDLRPSSTPSFLVHPWDPDTH
jgi:hypothetical protein